MNDTSRFDEQFAPPPANAPCGLGCSFASQLAGWPDFIWCARLRVPRSTLHDAINCPYFSSGPAAPPGPAALPNHRMN